MTEKQMVAISKYAIMQSDESALAEMLADAAGSDGINPITDLDRVTVPAAGGTAWQVPTMDGDESVKFIEGIIVHHQDVRAYWRSSMEESGGSAPPDCSSQDGITGIGDPGGTCNACPLAQFGSDSKQRGQACKKMKMLYVLRKDSCMPLAIALPPTSLKVARQYLLRLASRGVRPWGVITKIGLEQSKNPDGIKYSFAKFEPAGLLSAEDAARLESYAKKLRPSLGAVDFKNDITQAA